MLRWIRLDVTKTKNIFSGLINCHIILCYRYVQDDLKIWIELCHVRNSLDGRNNWTMEINATWYSYVESGQCWPNRDAHDLPDDYMGPFEYMNVFEVPEDKSELQTIQELAIIRLLLSLDQEIKEYDKKIKELKEEQIELKRAAAQVRKIITN